jgi:chromosome segregation ATPase
MDVEFLNNYKDVVLENFDAVLKQNLIFQTQLKIVSNIKNEKAEADQKIQELLTELERLNLTISQQQIELSSAESLKQRVVDGDAILLEKNRVQQALNETTQRVVGLEQELQRKQNEIDSLRQDLHTKNELVAQKQESDNKVGYFKTKLQQVNELVSQKDQEIEQLKNEIKENQKKFVASYNELKTYATQILEAVPTTKQKKLPEPPELNNTKVQSGGTF